MNKLIFLLNFLHLLVCFFVLFLLLNKSFRGYFNTTFKYIFLLIILIPLHWKFFDNHCFITYLSKKCGDFKNQQSNNHEFTEKYFKWLYEHLIGSFLGIECCDENIDKIIHTLWIIIIFIFWYFTFFEKHNSVNLDNIANIANVANPVI